MRSTVYGEPHLGHARPAIVFDLVFRYLKHLGFKVRYVQYYRRRSFGK